jgi:hypothetical protein
MVCEIQPGREEPWPSKLLRVWHNFDALWRGPFKKGKKFFEELARKREPLPEASIEHPPKGRPCLETQMQ